TGPQRRTKRRRRPGTFHVKRRGRATPRHRSVNGTEPPQITARHVRPSHPRRRCREHYGDRFAGIYAVPESPFSDEGPGEDADDVRAIEVVVILQKPYDPFEETDPPLVDIAMDVTEEYDWWVGIFVRHAGRDDPLAGWARE
ncbi:MAG: hypothetical protein V5A22_08460, partial [Salinivenus sp.]